jgi:glycine/D-amino acid oxidase-like deaminating enzyme
MAEHAGPPTATEFTFPDSTTAPLPKSADVVVVGGGIMGVASALYLARRGFDTVLVEKGVIAGEQSGRNWGWVRQTARDLDELPLMMASNQIWSSAEAEFGEDFEWTKKGIIAIARTPARIKFFNEWLATVKSSGVDSRFVPASELNTIIPKLEGDWLGALYTPSDGHAEPAKATQAFARAAAKAGATIIENCGVLDVRIANGKVEGVDTDRGRIDAKRVVLATGAWSSHVMRRMGLDLPVHIIRGTAAATKPVEKLADPAIGYHPVVSCRQRRNGQLYLAAGFWSDYDFTLEAFHHMRMFMPNLIKNHSVLQMHVGRPLLQDIKRVVRHDRNDRPWMRQRVADPPANPAKVKYSVEQFNKLFSTIPLEIESAWAGYEETPPDAVPVIDNLSTPAGLTLAVGFSGHGFGMGPIVGKIAADLVADGKTSFDMKPFRFSRFADGTYKKPRLVS